MLTQVVPTARRSGLPITRIQGIVLPYYFPRVPVSQTSRLTEKYQATIPADVRQALGLKKGDVVAFDIARGEVRLRRATPIDLAYASAVAGTLTEWDSKADENAFRDL